MTAKPIEGRTWLLADGHKLTVEETALGDATVQLWAATPDEQPGTCLTAGQARELSRDLVKRADRIDPPKRRRWDDAPASPESLLAAFLSDARNATERVFEDPPREIDMTWIRSMHVVDTFTVVVLLAELIAVAPKKARAIAELLHDAYEDGGVIHEWIWEWHTKHAKGEPVGFDPALVLELEVERPEEYR